MDIAGPYLSEQARHALHAARTLARERRHTALGPPHLLAAIMRQWNDTNAAGPALLRACGLTLERSTEVTATLLQTYDPSQDRAPAPAADARPNPALRFVLAQAFRTAAETRAPYVGTEHLVVATLWLDRASQLRRQGVTYAQAAEQLGTLPRTERAVDGEAIEPPEIVPVPTPAAVSLADLARQQAKQHPVDGRFSMLHYLLALSTLAGARKLLNELGVTYNALLERLPAEGARLVEADDQRPEELPPGDSGLTHQEVLDRLLGRASWPSPLGGEPAPVEDAGEGRKISGVGRLEPA